MRYLYIRVIGTTTEHGPRDLPAFQYVFVAAESQLEAERTGRAVCESPPENYYEMNDWAIEVPETPTTHLEERVRRIARTDALDEAALIAERFRDPNPWPTVYGAIAAAIREKIGT